MLAQRSAKRALETSFCSAQRPPDPSARELTGNATSRSPRAAQPRNHPRPVPFLRISVFELQDLNRIQVGADAVRTKLAAFGASVSSSLDDAKLAAG
jgi:hypothetical protein